MYSLFGQIVANPILCPAFVLTLIFFFIIFKCIELSKVCMFNLQNRLNITKTIRKFSIDSHLRPTGPEFVSGATTGLIKHDDDGEEDYGEGSLVLNGQNFERAAQE